jgi:hypothetical protein
MSKLPEVFAPGFLIAPGYQIIAHVSRGGALDVYDAWSEERQCRCIAKTLRPDRWGTAPCDGDSKPRAGCFDGSATPTSSARTSGRRPRTLSS